MALEQDGSKYSCIVNHIGHFIEIVCFDKIYRLKLPQSVTKYDWLEWPKFSHARNALFAGGKEWCPQEQMEYWRDDMHEIFGMFHCIQWEKPLTYHIVGL